MDALEDLRAQLPVINADPPSSWDEWLHHDIPPKDYLLGHWLHTQARVLLSAATGVGKSMLALEIACAVSTGPGFLHWPAGRPARVRYIDSEMGAEEVKDRLVRLADRHPEAVRDNLHVVSLEHCPEAKPLNTEAGRKWLLNLVNADNCELLILDNLMSLTDAPLTEEETWKAIEPLMLELSRRRCAVIVVHHAGHNATRYYGTSTMAWQMTACIHLEGRDNANGIHFSLSFKKARGRRADTASEYQDVVVRFDGRSWSTDADPAKQRPEKLGPLQEKFYEALKAAIIDSGGQLPRSKHYPNRRGVAVEAWREEAQRRGLLDGCKDEKSAGAKFSNYKTALIEKGVCVQYDAWIWLP
jgi:hypothetical protein